MDRGELSPRAKAAMTVGERLAAVLRSERNRMAPDAILERDSEDEGAGPVIVVARPRFLRLLCRLRLCLAPRMPPRIAPLHSMYPLCRGGGGGIPV